MQISSIEKYPISINHIDINKIVASKFAFCKQDFKYFNGYKDSEKIIMHRPLCIFRSQTIISKRNFDENRHIFFNKRRKSFY